MKYPSREAIKQHAIVASVVLFALACACLPPGEALSSPGLDAADAVQTAPDTADNEVSDFAASGGLVPDASATRRGADPVIHAAASTPDPRAGAASHLD